MRINFKRLSSPTFSAKFDSLYEGLDMGSRYAMWYYSIFTVRRLIYGISAVALDKHPIVQIAILNVQSTLVIIYLTLVKPFEVSYMNKLEIFNEICILIVSYHMFIFTDFVPDVKIR